jgi:ATPases involved in chromosome partitioning
MEKKVLLATGQQVIDDVVSKFEGYEVVGSTNYRSEIEEACKYYSPDIILVSEGLSGHEILIEILIRIKQNQPNVRIIYLAGNVEMRDTDKIINLGMLVLAGIYDIHHEKSISVPLLTNLFSNPKTHEQMSYLTKHLKNNSKVDKEGVVKLEVEETFEEDTEEQGYKNVFVVSSIKPGTGKSFISSNVATVIAKFGKKKPNGERPKVAIIEADLQNLSVGTLLQIEDDKQNLKSVMDKISTIITKDGDLISDVNKVAEVDEYIKSCFKPYYQLKNLEALVGSQFTMEEIEDVKPLYYVYLIESILKEFDVIIIDSNSSLYHTTTYPLLRLAKTCYYVLNLDFNNVRNNARYKETLKGIGILNKVKYILNEDIDNNDSEAQDTNGVSLEKLIYTADHLDESDFKLEARVPEIPKTVFLNRLYEGTPIVLDTKPYTLKSRYEIAKVANQIWELDNIPDLEKELEKLNPNSKKKGWFRK